MEKSKPITYTLEEWVAHECLTYDEVALLDDQEVQDMLVEVILVSTGMAATGIENYHFLGTVKHTSNLLVYHVFWRNL